MASARENFIGRNPVYACEGLDGVGKTSAAKLLAITDNAQYHHYMDGNPLASLREIALDPATPQEVKFQYYLGCAFDTYKQAGEKSLIAPVYADRTVFATLAYHQGLGVSDTLVARTPKPLLDQFAAMIYFTANDRTRLERLEARSNGAISNRDLESFKLGKIVDANYRSVAPGRTVIVETDRKTLEEVVYDVREQLARREKGKRDFRLSPIYESIQMVSDGA